LKTGAVAGIFTLSAVAVFVRKFSKTTSI